MQQNQVSGTIFRPDRDHVDISLFSFSKYFFQMHIFYFRSNICDYKNVQKLNFILFSKQKCRDCWHQPRATTSTSLELGKQSIPNDGDCGNGSGCCGLAISTSTPTSVVGLRFQRFRGPRGVSERPWAVVWLSGSL